jgi:hypothetical protein
MRKSVLVLAYAIAIGVAVARPVPAALADEFDRDACTARAERAADVEIAARGRVDLGWMGEPDHFAQRSPAAPYVVRIVTGEGPRSLLDHDRLVLPDKPADWIAVSRGADLVLCSRRLPAAVVVARHFCTASVSVGDIVNGEMEEISFLGGVTWLADDLLAQTSGGVPAEIADDLRHDVAMATPDGHWRDDDALQVVVYAPRVARALAAWTVVPMSEALGGQDTKLRSACLVRHADLRRGIVPARRVR